MNYPIIVNKESLESFVDTTLPELKESEVYFCSLFARKKYGAKQDLMLKRFTSNKEYLVQKIKKLEVSDGAYTYDDGSSIGKYHLALYINPTPRDYRKASFKLVSKLVEGFENNTFKNPVSLALSTIQKTAGTKKFIHFDMDVETKDIGNLFDYINKEACTIVETRGGYHILIDSTLVLDKFKNSFYLNIKRMENVDLSGDQLLPLVGCLQGGFVPKINNYE